VFAEVVRRLGAEMTSSGIERTASLDPGDLRAIARLTLPARHPQPVGDLPAGDDITPIQGQYHSRTKTYTITSPNLNLTVAGNFDAPGNENATQPGGTHRSFGLLSRGITRVPAYVRDFTTADDLAPAETVPRNAWLGDRPPLLRGYHDDLVAEPVLLPIPHLTIVIQATET